MALTDIVKGIRHGARFCVCVTKMEFQQAEAPELTTN